VLSKARRQRRLGGLEDIIPDIPSNLEEPLQDFAEGLRSTGIEHAPQTLQPQPARSPPCEMDSCLESKCTEDGTLNNPEINA